MDWSSKPCNSIARDVEKRNLVDRLSTLPNEVLVHILSLLPTKDAAAICVLSTQLMRVFPLITNLDFDVSTISLCVNHPYAIERYTTFVTFVTNVLEAYQSKYLTRFRLKVGSANFRSRYYEIWGCGPGGCKQDCLPDLKSEQLSSWISFPLTLCGLRELDLSILVREPGDNQLPPAIFMCQTLEVLKLEFNIGLDKVLAMPSYRLPNLKLLVFSVSFISDVRFLPRLLVGCPLLEDLEYQSLTEHVDHLIIQSTSLRRLCLKMFKVSDFQHDNTEFVLIDTPNLEHLVCFDNLACYYSIPTMDRLVKAKLCILEILQREELEISFQQLINLIIPVSYVQELTLCGYFLQEFNRVDVNVLKDQLPRFPNMKYLSLDGGGYFYDVFWHKMLLPLLNCSPVLETLVFEEGIIHRFYEISKHAKEQKELDQKFFKTVHPIPSCCRYHLKTLVIHNYYGKQREEEFIQFFLRHALILENLIVHRCHEPNILVPDEMLVDSTLRSMPKASVNCSIQVL